MNRSDRHTVNRGLRLAEPAEQVNRAILPFTRKGRAFDEAVDGLQAVMRAVMIAGRTVTVVVIVIMRVVLVMTVPAVIVIVMMLVIMMPVLVVSGSHRRRGALVGTKLGRRDARPEHAIGRHRAVLDRQAPERVAQTIDRKSQIEERPENHVARNAGETVEVSDL